MASNSRAQVIENIRDIMQLNAPSESMIEVTKELTKTCDPYTKFLIDYYLEIEKQRMEFFKMADPIFEGVVLPSLSNLADTIENNDVNAFSHDFVVQEVHLPDEPRIEAEYHTPHVNDKLRGSIKNLTFGLAAPKFVHPIEKAACELNVSEATLSLWCRISEIDYWPYRKLKSIDMLILTIQEIGSVEHEADNGVENAIKMLEEEKREIMKNSNLALKQSPLVMRKMMQNLTSIRRFRKRNLKNDKKQVGTDGDNIRYLLGQELRDKKIHLSFELVATAFGMPMEQAVRKLQVHRKTLQIWCRIHGITCWPYRKIQKMKKLLTNVQGLGHGELFGKEGSLGIIQKLEEEIITIENNPMIPIQDSTLALMKDVTKNCTKRRKLMKGKSKMHQSS